MNNQKLRPVCDPVVQRSPFIIPGVAWLVIFFLCPCALLLFVSFCTRGTYGEFQLPLTLENYQRLAGFGPFGFQPGYLIILGRTLVLALLTTVICGLIALPVSYGLIRLPARLKEPALIFLIIPGWTNLLVRTYAWQLILSDNGPLMRRLIAAGLFQPGDTLYPGLAAVMVCLVCDYLPFMVLAVYSAMERLDWSIVEAAADLGAAKFAAFRHAVLPQAMPGLKAGALLVFLPALGQFVIPDLLGGAKTNLLGNLIQQQFTQSRDWPFGAALTMMVFVLLLVWRRIFRPGAIQAI